MYLTDEATRQIFAYNQEISENDAEQYTNGTTIIFVSGLVIEMPEAKSGYNIVTYLEQDNTIRYEYEPVVIHVPELTPEERRQLDMEANLEYLTCLLEQRSL